MVGIGAASSQSTRPRTTSRPPVEALQRGPGPACVATAKSTLTREARQVVIRVAVSRPPLMRSTIVGCAAGSEHRPTPRHGARRGPGP
jgi:hypothetical protein